VVFDLDLEIKGHLTGRSVTFPRNQSGWLPWVEKESLVFSILTSVSGRSFSFLLNVEKDQTTQKGQLYVSDAHGRSFVHSLGEVSVFEEVGKNQQKGAL